VPAIGRRGQKVQASFAILLTKFVIKYNYRNPRILRGNNWSSRPVFKSKTREDRLWLFCVKSRLARRNPGVATMPALRCFSWSQG
jgi:hypothetical protein